MKTMKVEEAIVQATAKALKAFGAPMDTAAFLSSLRANGFVVVPVEATEDMRLVGCREMARQTGATYSPAKYQMAAVWRSMIAASHGDNQ